MATTLRQMLVKTLINIGEPASVANVPGSGVITDPYQIQICNFINHIKEEAEQEHQWSRRWQTFTMSYTAGNTTQQILDAGGYLLPSGAYPYSSCSVVRMHNPKMGREVALCFDITTFGIPFVLDEMPLADITYYNTVLNQTPVAYSTNFCIQDDGSDNVQLVMYPGANQTRLIQITLYNPQPYIDCTVAGSAIDTWIGTVGIDSPISMPARIVELGAAWYALSERGEELGQNSMFSEDKYRRALDDLATKDRADQGDLMMVVA